MQNGGIKKHRNFVEIDVGVNYRKNIGNEKQWGLRGCVFFPMEMNPKKVSYILHSPYRWSLHMRTK